MESGVFAGADENNVLSYQREWFKERAMIEAMRASPEIRRARTVLFDDRTTAWNANGRTSRRDYEYAGMFVEAFGDQTRLGADLAEYRRYGAAAYRRQFTPLYKMGDHVEGPPDAIVMVQAGQYDLGPASTVLRLLVAEWTGDPRLGDDLRRALRFRVVTVQTSSR